MNRTFRRLRRFFLALAGLTPALAVLLQSGCGGPADAPVLKTLYPVKGTVLLDSGKPVTTGRVVLVSSDGMLSSTGDIGSDGSFAVKSSGGDGVPAGDYKVRIESDSGKAGGKGAGRAHLPFATKYTDEDSSGLKVTVKAEPNTLDPFKLSTKEAPSPRAGGGSPRDRD